MVSLKVSAPKAAMNPLVVYDVAGAIDSAFMLKLLEDDSMKFLSDITHYLVCQFMGFVLRIVSRIWTYFDPDN